MEIQLGKVVMSSILFNIYGERIIKKSCSSTEGRKILKLRQADDTTQPTNTETVMAQLLQRAERYSR